MLCSVFICELLSLYSALNVIPLHYCKIFQYAQQVHLNYFFKVLFSESPFPDWYFNMDKRRIIFRFPFNVFDDLPLLKRQTQRLIKTRLDTPALQNCPLHFLSVYSFTGSSEFFSTAHPVNATFFENAVRVALSSAQVQVVPSSTITMSRFQSAGERCCRTPLKATANVLRCS